MKRPQDLVVDLANCEDEPIRTPGAIQPHGLMIVVDYDLQILQVSTNTREILEYKASALVEQNISALMSGEDLSLLKRFLDFESLQTLVPIPITLLSSAGKTFKSTCQGHRYSEYFILEFEPVVEDHLQQVLSVSGLLANSIAHLQSAQSLSDVMHIAADEVKKMTGYDRVMVYKFDKDWHGEVIAEAKQESLEPLLGLHYPAADIPVQARELYKRNLTRMIVDVDYNSCAIVPQINQKTNTILDMSDCVLRSVSPIHVEYLTNMGVRATLTISLMVKGELWGLIACHHYSTKYLPLVLRSASQMFGQHLSLALQGYSRAERYKTAAINLRAFDDFFAVFRTTNGDIVKAFEMWGEKLIDTFNCCGTALMTKDVIYAIGETLSDSEIKKAISSIEQFNAPVFATDSICTIKDLNGKSDLAGMLAWKISAINNDWIMCFRPEQSKSVKWAGRPQKDVEVVNNKGRLHPRGSFALWIEQVKNTSEPWAEHNIDTAEYLRTKILELRQESIDRDREDHNKTTTARDEFVANIAHDLKTPILGAIKVLEFIRDGHIGGVEKQSSRGNGPSSNDNCSIYRNDESSISSNSSSPKNILGTTSGEIIPETTQLRTIIDQLITSHQNFLNG
jgi:light-regulated signal transduction histidine kinase (bacteriophytochrome)